MPDDVVRRERRIPSESCGLDDLALYEAVSAEARSQLRLAAGWSSRWTMRWQTGGAPAVASVREASGWPVPGCAPVRRFSWRTRQRHRPGLQFMISTGRHHGFESLAEQQVLVAFDFLCVVDVLSQPFELRFTVTDGWASHVPDFLVLGRDGVWLVNVRPAGRIRDADRRCFAAAAEVALCAGWRSVVVSGWRAHVLATLDAMSAQRRTLDDPMGLQPQLIQAVVDGGVTFADLVAATSLPAVARAHALHLLWRRRLGLDLARPLADSSLLWPVPAACGAR